jgi:hypothetical protein
MQEETMEAIIGVPMEKLALVLMEQITLGLHTQEGELETSMVQAVLINMVPSTDIIHQMVINSSVQEDGHQIMAIRELDSASE